MRSEYMTVGCASDECRRLKRFFHGNEKNYPPSAVARLGGQLKNNAE